MLIKLLSNQIPAYEDVINETIEKAIPRYQEKLRTKLYEDLLFGISQCWVSTSDNQFEAIIITRISEDTAKGGKVCTLIAGYAPGGTSEKSFIEGWEAVSKFAKMQNCDLIDLYTDNSEIEKYMKLFPKIWETKYYQIDLKED